MFYRQIISCIFVILIPEQISVFLKNDIVQYLAYTAEYWIDMIDNELCKSVIDMYLGEILLHKADVYKKRQLEKCNFSVVISKHLSP